jgi:hypothetical protein
MVHAAGDRIFGKYRIVRVLGAGGFGHTYIAEAPDGARVVVKELRVERGGEWKALQLFEREAQVLARLNHPGIPRLVESFLQPEAGESMGLVQQYVDGDPLPVAMLRWTPTESEARALAVRLLDIVVYLQSLHPHVLHRDIKPANVLRAANGAIHLIDFGSVASERGEGITVAGTPGFMAPEQIVGQAGPETDVYGVAATILHVLTRRSPAFQRWLSRALEPEREDRFASAAQAREALLRSDRDGRVRAVARAAGLAVTGAAAVSAAVGLGSAVMHRASAIAGGGGGSVRIDADRRTVTTGRFFAQWSLSDAKDPEALDVLRWRGQPSITRTLGTGACNNGDVEYFGNAWAGAMPQGGDKVFVGAGGAGTWKALDGSVAIASASSGCPPSMELPVTTTYTFSADGAAADVIRVRRVIDFGATAFRTHVRPYIPRFNLAAFSKVIHPDAAGAAGVTEDVLPCGWVCQKTNWDGTWFAVVASAGPFVGQGVVVVRRRTAASVALWLDNDSGSSTNASGVVILPPPGGFTGRLQEDEALCFFDDLSWPTSRRAALELPEA